MCWHFCDRCETYTQALIECSMMKYPKYLAVHCCAAKSLPLSFVLNIKDVSYIFNTIFL